MEGWRWEKQDHPREKQDHPRGAPGWYTFAINSLKSASYQLRSGQNRTRTAFSCKIQTSAWHPRSGDRGQERGIISDDHRTDFLQAIQDSLRSQRKAFFLPRNDRQLATNGQLKAMRRSCSTTGRKMYHPVCGCLRFPVSECRGFDPDLRPRSPAGIDADN